MFTVGTEMSLTVFPAANYNVVLHKSVLRGWDLNSYIFWSNSSILAVLEMQIVDEVVPGAPEFLVGITHGCLCHQLWIGDFGERKDVLPPICEEIKKEEEKRQEQW